MFLANLFSPELHVPQSFVCSVFLKRLNPYLISSRSSGTIPLIYPLASSLLPAVTALLDRTPLGTVPTHTQLQSSPEATAWGGFRDQFQMFPLFFWYGCALGKRNLGSSFPPHLHWFAQTDISNTFNSSNFGQIFQAPVLIES